MLFVAACVGDSPGGPTSGQAGGPCFSNGTCNAGLSCVGGFCVAVDAGGDDGASPSSDGGADGSSGEGGVDTQNDPNNCGTLGHVCPSHRCKGGDCFRRVFVTSGTTKGTFGGAAGADNVCKVSVGGTTMKGTFYAWVSTSSSSPATHFTKGTAPYVLVDGTTVVANDYAGLAGVNGTVTLAHAIDTDENGVQKANADVWTATHPDGTENGPPNCSDFGAQPSDANAPVGSSSMVNTTWTESTTLPCGTFAHVYCVEQ